MMVTQRQWRLAGGVALVLASAMAAFAVLTDVLRDSVMLIVALTSEKVAEAAESITRWPLVVFWSVFGLLITLALYLAAVDIRYIRKQYDEERRSILRHTLQEQAFRESLRERSRNTARGSTNTNS